MADTYFQSFTADSNLKIQIDDTFSNIVYAGKSSLSLPASNSSRFNYVDITFYGTNAQIAISSNDPISCYLKSQSATSKTWSICSRAYINGYPGHSSHSGGSVVTCYFFVDDSGISGGNFGLQTFNAQGKLVYDSNKRYASVYSYEIGQAPSNPPKQFDGAKVFAAMVLEGRFGSQSLLFPPGPGPHFQYLTNYFASSFFMKTSSSFNAIEGQVGAFMSGMFPYPLTGSDIPQGSTGGRGTYLIIDVTGL